MPRHPMLYQVNTRILLGELSERIGHQASLADIPDAALDHVAELGFDWVWLLGVWQTGPASRHVSGSHHDWMRGYPQVLPDFHFGDVCGSPFAVQDYAVHADFGGNDALVHLRERLVQRGIHLLLDFVPNHTGLDHRWVNEAPHHYILGSEDDLAREPHNYCRLETSAGPRVFAHGRDPYFPGWPDTLQLNYRHPDVRRAMIDQLERVSQHCDGVRCDMAMLLLPEVFQRTWGDRALPADDAPASDAPFWPDAIARIRAAHPNFIFLAEVYWDLEWTLQQQGFDYTYDKRLYDRLVEGSTPGVRAHLHADAAYQNKLLRFLENHDERRAAAAFPSPQHQAAAVITYLVPGMRLFHEGQFDGRQIQASIHLTRRAHEPSDPEIKDFYAKLLRCLRHSQSRTGYWQLLDCHPVWHDNPTYDNFIAFYWEPAAHDDHRLLVVVNYSATQSQCHLPLPFPDLAEQTHLLRDLLSPAAYERQGDNLLRPGLFLDMPPWGYHAFEITRQ